MWLLFTVVLIKYARWIVVAMPTSGKSTLFKFLHGLLQDVRKKCTKRTLTQHGLWKRLALKRMMADNNGKLIDELSVFLSGINLYSSEGIPDA